MGAAGARLLLGPAAPKIVTAMCLQLIAFIDRDMPVRRCANDNCRSLFALQRGRAEFGQYRTRGVKYCSDSCAQAQAQRNYRRRRQAAADSAGG